MAPANDYAGIERMLSEYFDGLYFSDIARLSSVFHPRSHYVCVTDGSLTYRSMDEYLPMVEKRPAPAAKGEQRRDRIVSIEFAGATTAMARVQCSIGEKFFTDLLTLIFVDGRWQVISKVFHVEPV